MTHRLVRRKSYSAPGGEKIPGGVGTVFLIEGQFVPGPPTVITQFLFEIGTGRGTGHFADASHRLSGLWARRNFVERDTNGTGLQFPTRALGQSSQLRISPNLTVGFNGT